MHPVLFNIGSIPIRSYGVMLALSFLLGIMLAYKRARKFNIEPTRIIDLSLVIIIAAAVGSRFFYVIYHLNEFSGHYLDTINPFQSNGEVGLAGLSMMGGVVLVLILTPLFIKIWKMPLWETLDAFSPSFMLGVGITRIGCFLNGCCYGDPTNWFWGVVFPPTCAAGWHFPGMDLHPTQLISSAAGFIMFGILLLLERKPRFRGYTFLMMLALYSGFRFTIDFFRYYEPSMVFTNIGGIDFSNNQAITIVILLAAVASLIAIPKIAKRKR